MTIDASFIGAIRNLTAKATESEMLRGEDGAPDLVGWWKAHDNGFTTYEVTSLEQYNDTPRRKKGAVTVYDAESFATYFNTHKTEASVIFADGDSVLGVLNHHSGDAPGWGDHTVRLALKLHPEWAAWTQLVGSGFVEQEDFANHLEIYQNNILDPVAGYVLDLARELKIHSNAEFQKVIRSGDGTVQIHFTDTHTTTTPRGTIDLKDGLSLVLQLSPFDGAPPLTIEGIVQYKLNNGALFFRLVFGDRVRVALEAARNERRGVIQALTATPVLLGKVG